MRDPNNLYSRPAKRYFIFPILWPQISWRQLLLGEDSLSRYCRPYRNSGFHPFAVFSYNLTLWHETIPTHLIPFPYRQTVLLSRIHGVTYIAVCGASDVRGPHDGPQPRPGVSVDLCRLLAPKIWSFLSSSFLWEGVVDILDQMLLISKQARTLRNDQNVRDCYFFFPMAQVFFPKTSTPPHPQWEGEGVQPSCRQPTTTLFPWTQDHPLTSVPFFMSS